jgi:ADP-heptose:LPS heptosyltransferase
MTTPALQRLRERFPQAHITLLTHEKLGALWQHHPSLDAVIPFSPGEGPWSVAGRLRALDFQAALVLPNSLRSALEVWLARIPRRIGRARPGCNWLLTHSVSPRPGHSRMSRRSVAEVNRLIRTNAGNASSAARRPAASNAHQVHDYLHLAAALGASPEALPPRLEIPPAEVHEAREALVPGHPLVVLGLNPGAEYGPAKRWPAQSFAAVARDISGKLGNCLWLAFGTAGDWELCDQIAREAEGRVLNLAGKTSLRQLMALLKLCRVLLTNDTGPMHVAAALGTPVVVPFGSTSPELTGPGLPGDSRHRLLQSNAPCSPCFRRECPIDFRCMAGITVEQVVKAVWQVVSPS